MPTRLPSPFMSSLANSGNQWNLVVDDMRGRQGRFSVVKNFCVTVERCQSVTTADVLPGLPLTLF